MRYERQLMLPQIGEAEQLLLKKQRVLIVGSGGIGSPLVYYLAASGVGALRIVDGDVVSLSNLQRQILFQTADMGKPKAEVAAQRAQAINPNCRAEGVVDRFTERNAIELISGCSIIVDATDNLSSRYLLDRVAQQANIPYLYGAIEGYLFQVALFTYREGQASYRELFPEYDADKEQLPVAVFGPAVGVLGSLMAAQVIKAMLHIGDTLENKLLQCDVRSLQCNLISL